MILIAVKISDIKENMGDLVVIGTVISISKIKIVQTKFGMARVAQALFQDSTGTIIINLWRNQIDTVKTGDIIKVEKAFVRKFGTQLELNVGNDGRILVIEAFEKK